MPMHLIAYIRFVLKYCIYMYYITVLITYFRSVGIHRGNSGPGV